MQSIRISETSIWLVDADYRWKLTWWLCPLVNVISKQDLICFKAFACFSPCNCSTACDIVLHFALINVCYGSLLRGLIQAQKPLHLTCPTLSKNPPFDEEIKNIDFLIISLHLPANVIAQSLVDLLYFEFTLLYFTWFTFSKFCLRRSSALRIQISLIYACVHDKYVIIMLNKSW